MNRNSLIGEIKNIITLYKDFINIDYPDLNIFTGQYLDILIKYYNHVNIPYSVIYSDINKLSIVNERYGKDIGDKTLYTLLRLFTLNFKNCPTVRIGGDEFVTFVAHSTKEEVDKKLKLTEININRQSNYLYGSSIAFATEDSSNGNVEELIELTEKKVAEQKQKNENKNVYLTQANNSEKFIELSIPKGISEEQQKKWKILNNKINVLADNHLRDIRPSNVRFEYLPDHIRKDSKSFIYAFSNLLNNISNSSSKKDNEELVPERDISITPKSAILIHTLFKGEEVNFENLSDEEIASLKNSLEIFCNSIIKEKHSGLLGKSYYKLFLADKLLHSKQTYQAVYFSMSGIRPSNTAYGHLVTDGKIEKTSQLLINAFESKRNFNNEPFTFSKNDIFFIDQSGGNFLALIPNKQKLKPNEIEEIVNNVNSQCTESKDSSLKISYALKEKVNRKTIPFFVNSMAGNQSNSTEWFRTIHQVIKNMFRKNYLLETTPQNIYNSKPFVQFARRLKEDCNNNKDYIKIDNLDKLICQDSIETIANDCISYFYNEIEGSTSIAYQKLLLDNVILALANHEAYVNTINKKTLTEKLNKRKIFGNKTDDNIAEK